MYSIKKYLILIPLLMSFENFSAAETVDRYLHCRGKPSEKLYAKMHNWFRAANQSEEKWKEYLQMVEDSGFQHYYDENSSPAALGSFGNGLLALRGFVGDNLFKVASNNCNPFNPSAVCQKKGREYCQLVLLICMRSISPTYFATFESLSPVPVFIPGSIGMYISDSTGTFPISINGYQCGGEKDGNEAVKQYYAR